MMTKKEIKNEVKKIFPEAELEYSAKYTGKPDFYERIREAGLIEMVRAGA